MTGIQDKRRAIRHLLREDDPADAMAAYYALYPVSYTHLDVYKRQLQLREEEYLRVNWFLRHDLS